MALKRRRFAAQRRACGFSQESFAEAVGVDRTTVARWESGDTEPQPWHRRRIAGTLGLSLLELDELLADIHDANPDQEPPPGGDSAADDAAAELHERLHAAAAVDDRAITVLGAQADRIREVDRMLGARAAQAPLRGHLASLDGLRSFAISPGHREPLARLYADAATLAGWQCLDLGELARAWEFYEAARAAGHEARSPATLSHAMAEQAYVLAEVGELGSAVQLAEHAHQVAGTAVPALLLAWLWSVLGELYAAAGDDGGCRRAFETAGRLLPADGDDPELPYVVLSGVHLARWRGNALARLGDAAATEDLQRALHGMDATFTRARAGLHVDLAHALLASHQPGEARTELRRAKTLAVRVGSARQRRRIRRLESTLAAA